MTHTIQKEHEIARSQLATTKELNPQLALLRDGELAVCLVCAGASEALATAHITVSPFRADAVVLTTDGYQLTTPSDQPFDEQLNPWTEEPWQAGDMAMYFDAGNEGNLISEVLTSVGVTGDGNAELILSPYVRKGDIIRLEDPVVHTHTDGHLGGRIAKLLATIVKDARIHGFWDFVGSVGGADPQAVELQALALGLAAKWTTGAMYKCDDEVLEQLRLQVMFTKRFGAGLIDHLNTVYGITR